MVEAHLWSVLRNRRVAGHMFHRQATVGPFVVDFLCVEARLIVELDGGQHIVERDAPRTVWLDASGYRVLRFWNNEVTENLDGVAQVILDALSKKKTLTPPSPAKAGEG